MDIKLTEKPKEIEKIKEFAISIDNIETFGVSAEFSFRCVYKNKNLNHILYPYSENKWSKKPNKSLLRTLDISAATLDDILREYVSMAPLLGQTISSLCSYDFEEEGDPDD